MESLQPLLGSEVSSNVSASKGNKQPAGLLNDGAQATIHNIFEKLREMGNELSLESKESYLAVARGLIVGRRQDYEKSKASVEFQKTFGHPPKDIETQIKKEEALLKEHSSKIKAESDLQKTFEKAQKQAKEAFKPEEEDALYELLEQEQLNPVNKEKTPKWFEKFKDILSENKNKILKAQQVYRNNIANAASMAHLENEKPQAKYCVAEAQYRLAKLMELETQVQTTLDKLNSVANSENSPSKEMVDLYKKAADQGHIYAQYELLKLYKAGKIKDNVLSQAAPSLNKFDIESENPYDALDKMYQLETDRRTRLMTASNQPEIDKIDGFFRTHKLSVENQVNNIVKGLAFKIIKYTKDDHKALASLTTILTMEQAQQLGQRVSESEQALLSSTLLSVGNRLSQHSGKPLFGNMRGSGFDYAILKRRHFKVIYKDHLQKIGAGATKTTYVGKNLLSDQTFAWFVVQTRILELFTEIGTRNELETEETPNVTPSFTVISKSEYEVNMTQVRLQPAEKLWADPKCKLQVKLDILSKILITLQHMFLNNKTYTDLKVENFLVEQDQNQIKNAYLTDYDGVINIGSPTKRATLVTASPETATGDPVSAEEVMFSFGVILYHAVLGSPVPKIADAFDPFFIDAQRRNEKYFRDISQKSIDKLINTKIEKILRIKKTNLEKIRGLKTNHQLDQVPALEILDKEYQQAIDSLKVANKLLRKDPKERMKRDELSRALQSLKVPT